MYCNNRSEIIDICNNDYEYFLNKANVLGIALSCKVTNGQVTNENCIQVLVTNKLPKKQLSCNDIIDKVYKGIPTDVVETGEIKSVALTSRVRPMLFGYSVGPHMTNLLSAGTAGCLVSAAGKYYILSNNHVLAMENSLPLNTPILQPANLDGGVYTRDVIANLTKFVPIQFETPTASPINYVDAAIAGIVDIRQVSSSIYLIGNVRGTSLPILGGTVKKAGRTTGLTTGTITATNATVKISYSNGKTALFQNQIISTAMSSPGDSGSLLLNSNNYAIGLLFAGSTSTTVYNPINTVLSALGIKLVTR